MRLEKSVAVAVEFAEKVALARVRFKNAKLSQMDMDWYESKWKTFSNSAEVDHMLNTLTDALSLYWDVDQELKLDPTNLKLFLNRAEMTRQISKIRHKLFLLASDANTNKASDGI
jgi:hypothetical protein